MPKIVLTSQQFSNYPQASFNLPVRSKTGRSKWNKVPAMTSCGISARLCALMMELCCDCTDSTLNHSIFRKSTPPPHTHTHTQAILKT